MNSILRSAASGLLWGVVLATGALVAGPAQAGGGWRDERAWRDDGHGRGYDGYHEDADDYDYDYGGDRGHGYGYGYGDDYNGHDRRWRSDDDRHHGDWRRHGRYEGGYRESGWPAGRVWCPQRRAYVLPWEVRGWQADRHRHWRHRDRYGYRHRW